MLPAEDITLCNVVLLMILSQRILSMCDCEKECIEYRYLVVCFNKMWYRRIDKFWFKFGVAVVVCDSVVEW